MDAAIFPALEGDQQGIGRLASGVIETEGAIRAPGVSVAPADVPLAQFSRFFSRASTPVLGLLPSFLLLLSVLCSLLALSIARAISDRPDRMF